MRRGFRKGFLRIKNITEKAVGMMSRTRGSFWLETKPQSVSEHDLRDVGLLDGRVSPSTVERHEGSRILHGVDAPPRWL